jgi:hypothetical protein
MHPGGAVVHKELVAHGSLPEMGPGPLAWSVAEYRTVRDQSVAMPDILQPVWATTVAPCSSQNNIASTAATHTPLPQRVISGGYRSATATIARHKEFRDEYPLACEHRAEELGDEMLEIIDDPSARLRFKALARKAARMAPRRAATSIS